MLAPGEQPVGRDGTQDDKGIAGHLTIGDNVDKSNGIPFKNTVYQKVKEQLGAQPEAMGVG